MKINYKPFGDSALLLEWEQKIDEAINRQVIQLSEAIIAASISGFRYTIPAYCSLTVGFDPKTLSFDLLCQEVQKLASNLIIEKRTSFRNLKIPVCYEPPYALDFDDLSLQTGLSSSEIITLHTSSVFRVYMLGFIPGFAYMGKLPNALFCTRKTTPRKKVPPLSVGLAGFQTGIYPSAAPGGWQIIGRTPQPVFDNTKSDPILFRAGDQVQFYAIDAAEFERLEQKQ